MSAQGVLSVDVDMFKVRAFLAGIAGPAYAEMHAAEILQELRADGYSVVSRHASMTKSAVFFGTDLREANGKDLIERARAGGRS